MDEKNLLAEKFEAYRGHLRSVGYRMLGTMSEAEDAVQEAWLRLSRSDPDHIDNLGGWLTTVVARVCLDMLRSRQSRREEPLEPGVPEAALSAEQGIDPEQDMLIADSVGLALLVVLERLAPPERLAFVLHDMFAVPFEEIAPIVGRSAEATRQLASRARRRVQGADMDAAANLSRQREIVGAFLAASKGGDFDGLLALLDPDVILRGDNLAARMSGHGDVRGATLVAQQFKGRAQAAQVGLIDGTIGIVVAPQGRLLLVLRPTIRDGRIAEINVVAEPEQLSRLDIAALAPDGQVQQRF